ncbi:MAG TPA: YceI family protein [Solirubrobacteraceae bacterium]|jgi:polyisoprenoid-binding protein YceI
MASWIFEPGHTEAEFRARHMMVAWVRGLFKDIHGRLELDWDRCLDATFEGEIDATEIWTGDPARDEHLRSADFFDVENHPKITFSGHFTERTGGTTFKRRSRANDPRHDADGSARHRLSRRVDDAMVGGRRQQGRDATYRL